MTSPQPPGVPKRKTRHAKAYVIGSVAFVVLIIAAGVYLYRGSGSDKASVLSPQEQAERLNETGDAVAQMLKNQIVTKIEDDRGRVSVSASAWDSASYDQKASMAHALAKFCAAVHGTARMDCEIVDDQTGRRLARYTNDGLTLY